MGLGLHGGFTRRRRLTDRLSLRGGYTLRHLTEVVRSGDQIDSSLNPTRIDGALYGELDGEPRPAPRFRSKRLRILGLHFGGQCEF